MKDDVLFPVSEYQHWGVLGKLLTTKIRKKSRSRQKSFHVLQKAAILRPDIPTAGYHPVEIYLFI